MAAWYNGDASEFRTFLADLIDAEVLEDVEDVKRFCDKPQKWDRMHTAWVENDYELPDEDDDEDDEEEGE